MIDKIEELKLIAKCVAFDDRHAFARLVDAHAPGLHSLLFNLTRGNAALTDDLAQETFLKAYTQLRHFRGMARFGTWLHRIAYNEFVSHCRRQREECLPEGYDIASEYSSQFYARFDVRHDVTEAMKTLSETERTLVILFYFDDQSIKDISKMTSLPEGTVKSYLHRAKKKMAKFLEL